MSDEPKAGPSVGAVVANRIREVRQHRGLNQRELAEIIERDYDYALDASMVNKIENGVRSVSLDDLLVIAAALNVSPPSLITSTNPLEGVRVGNRYLASPAFLSWCAAEKPASFIEDPLDSIDGVGFFQESLSGMNYMARQRVPALQALNASRAFLELWVGMLLPAIYAGEHRSPLVEAQTNEALDRIEGDVRDLRQQVEGLTNGSR